MSSFGENETKFPRVIAFFGPDGAGKSTQAQLVINYLKSRGFKVRKAWVRSVHTFTFLLWNLFVRFNLRRHRSNIPIQLPKKPAVSYLREETYGAVSPISMTPPSLNGPISRLIWSTIEVVSILPVILLQVYIPLLLGHTIVAERYVVDSIATIAYFINDKNFTRSRLAKLLLKFIPKRTMFIFVDAEYKTIVKRRGSTAGPPDYTTFHRRIYRELTPVVRAIYVNTSKLSVEETHVRIIKFVMKTNTVNSTNRHMKRSFLDSYLYFKSS